MFHRHWLRLLWVAAGAALVVNAGIRPVAAGYQQGGSTPPVAAVSAAQLSR